MRAEPLTAETGIAPGPQDQNGGELLWLVRQLIACGRELLTSLQQQNNPAADRSIARRFGTFNIALIIARITRGLAIAAFLEARLLRRPVSDRPRPVATRPAAAAKRSTKPAGRRAKMPTEDDDALLRGLPTAREIAKRLRHRTTGDVLVEICRDLGIDTTHPLWREIQQAIYNHDGNMASMLNAWADTLAVMPMLDLPEDDPSEPIWSPPSAWFCSDWAGHGSAAGTGPPP